MRPKEKYSHRRIKVKIKIQKERIWNYIKRKIRQSRDTNLKEIH